MTTPPVFLVDALPGEGTDTVLGGREGHHAATVRRLRPGEMLVLTDGHGGTARCAVTSTGKDELRLHVLGRHHRAAPQPRIVVVQGLIKGDRSELAVELATEAGADAIVPWRATRCIARWNPGPRGDRALARWRNTATEAAKQARRPWFPTVHDPVDTPALAQLVQQAAAALVLHESANSSIGTQQLPSSGDLLVVVGPEGGITDSERETLHAAGATTARLGPTVLRASTAAAVALGALGPLTGRWQ